MRRLDEARLTLRARETEMAQVELKAEQFFPLHTSGPVSLQKAGTGTHLTLVPSLGLPQDLLPLRTRCPQEPGISGQQKVKDKHTEEGHQPYPTLLSPQPQLYLLTPKSPGGGHQQLVRNFHNYICNHVSLLKILQWLPSHCPWDKD